MGTPGSSSGKPPLKARELLGSKNTNASSLVSLNSLKGSNYHKEMQRRHKKSLAITHLIKLQALQIKSINAAYLKEMTLDRTREFKGIYGYFNKGHLELLRCYGDEQDLINRHDLDPQILE